MNPDYPIFITKTSWMYGEKAHLHVFVENTDDHGLITVTHTKITWAKIAKAIEARDILIREANNKKRAKK